jgi:hypothetical protein
MITFLAHVGPGVIAVADKSDRRLPKKTASAGLSHIKALKHLIRRHIDTMTRSHSTQFNQSVRLTQVNAGRRRRTTVHRLACHCHAAPGARQPLIIRHSSA